jgi:hypothetical protein
VEECSTWNIMQFLIMMKVAIRYSRELQIIEV